MDRRPKILYMELLDNNYGNRRLDLQVIKGLKDISDLTVAYPSGWFDNLPDGISAFSYCYSHTSKNEKISYYQRSLHNLNVAAKLDKEKHFDYLFFASYETYVMALSIFKLRNIRKRVFIVHHNNIDLLDKSSKLRFFFKKYAKRVNHVIFEEFIGEHLRDAYDIEKSKIFYIPHPLNEIEGNIIKQYDCVGISNSNQEKWIEEIVKSEKYKPVLKDQGVKVVLRSKKITFDDGYLKVIKGYLSDEEYYRYIKSAKVVFLPFSESFKYRTSGSIVDAFSNGTFVIGSRILLFGILEKKYPGICYIVDSAQELIEHLICLKNIHSAKEQNFSTFKHQHSADKLKESLEKMFIC